MFPKEIKKLNETVVNRIAAGEVIQRPANALKEMIENSLDAKSTLIQITVKTGGIKFFQIQDNGTGIRKDNLDIVCERFTTSKLEHFDDLKSISTFGFRGEALASISHVAHLNIQTKTINDQFAFKASYEDGKIKSPPKPCAGNQGTIITVENLFYNVPQRKQALKIASEEFQKISEVVSKYAVHNSHVGFVLKKSGENPSIKTSAKNNITDNIKTIFGAHIAKELMEIKLEDEVHKFKLTGWLTNINYSGKKSILLIFINHRLIDSQSLKAAIDSVYSTYLPKGSYPFCYMHLELISSNVDVNVHPTKHEVHFLNEDDIVEKIKLYLETKLLGSNSVRTFYKQLRIPGASEVLDQSINKGVKIQPKDVVRTDCREQKLEKFLTSQDMINDVSLEKSISQKENLTKSNNLVKKETKLSSILNMRKKIENDCSKILRTTLKETVFIGIVNKKYALVQYESKLLLCNTFKLSYELFYQLLVYNFENFKENKLNPPVLLKDLALIALDMQITGWTEEDGSKIDLANKITELLIDKSKILKEYFGLCISNGCICSLPILLENHKPDMTRLPLYILRLATNVDWNDEIDCFKSFIHETADFYSYISQQQSEKTSHNWMLAHILYPAIKQYLIPKTKLKEYILEITNIASLYKVFERC